MKLMNLNFVSSCISAKRKGHTRWPSKPKRKPSPGTDAIGFLTLDFQAPQLWENKFLSFKSASILLLQPNISPSGIRDNWPSCSLFPFFPSSLFSSPTQELPVPFLMKSSVFAIIPPLSLLSRLSISKSCPLVTSVWARTFYSISFALNFGCCNIYD